MYHSSETEGYKSVILIQMTPDTIPTNLALVHLKVYVQGIENIKVFEADPGLKYTFSWDRINAFRQKVYGIVPVKVHVGYEYKGCDYVFWEVRSTTMTGFDLTSSEIGGWNLDIHHTYNFQEGKSLWIATSQNLSDDKHRIFFALILVQKGWVYKLFKALQKAYIQWRVSENFYLYFDGDND